MIPFAKISKILLCLLFAALLAAHCPGQNKPASQPKPSTMRTGIVNAPEINTSYGWLNTDRSYSIKDFRGKIVLLDFWTFGCINCQHIIPDLRRLEREYARELVVVGVHSAKFQSEKTNQNIRKAILKFGIEHPVVNDADYQVWQAYGVRAWPTVALISPDGKVVGQRSGEGVYDAVKPLIDELIGQYGDKIKREVMSFRLEKDKEKNNSPLRFPSKMVADADGNVWFADSGNNRVVKITPDGKLLETIGKAEGGFTDGTFAAAAFYEPHGLALRGDLLYIADTKNNAIRVADLKGRQVRTVAGNGKMGYYFMDDQWGVNVLPNSPWDLQLAGNQLYIANAGNHQVLRMDLNTNQVFRFAGTGREALADGPLREAAFNQPSGLALTGNLLYVADPEASAVRAIDLDAGQVSTPVGKGLFDFGDRDGSVDEALLQHCVGLAHRDGKLYIADTYNGKIKVLDLAKKRVSTLVAGLNEPNDVLFTGEEMWVSDTNNHQLVKINLRSSEKKTVAIRSDM
jgi:thiol-disulfide isomerase/thioredoxin